MGLDDLLIKKYAKRYLRQTLANALKKPKKPLVTVKQVSNYLAEQFEDIYEKVVMKSGRPNKPKVRKL